MATVKRATKVTGKATRKFNSLQDIVNHINNGKPVVALQNFGPTIGAQLTKQAGVNSYVTGAYACICVVYNGCNYNWNVTLTQVGYQGNFTKEELEEEQKELKTSLALVQAKLAYLKETEQEEFDETEFKVWNTLQLLKEKSTDLEKAKAIASLINS